MENGETGRNIIRRRNTITRRNKIKKCHNRKNMIMENNIIIWRIITRRNKIKIKGTLERNTIMGRYNDGENYNEREK